MTNLAKFRAEVVFILLLMGCFGYASASSLGFDSTARYMPLGASVVGLIACGVLLIVLGVGWLRGRSSRADTIEGISLNPGSSGQNDVLESDASSVNEETAVLKWVIWISAYVALIWLVGMILGTLVYICASLWWLMRPKWWVYLVGAGLVLLLWNVSRVFNLDFPSGVFASVL